MKRFPALLILILSASPVWAHKFKVFAFAEGPVIEGEAYFAGAGKAAGAIVTLARDGQIVATTQTSDDGSFIFGEQIPAMYVINADASQGHVAEYTITAEEMGGGDSIVQPISQTSAAASRSAPVAAFDQKALAAVVDKSVARQLRPLREQIDQLQEKRYYQDILGGIGYIFGIAGLASMVLSRKRRQS